MLESAETAPRKWPNKKALLRGLFQHTQTQGHLQLEGRYLVAKVPQQVYVT